MVQSQLHLSPVKHSTAATESGAIPWATAQAGFGLTVKEALEERFGDRADVLPGARRIPKEHWIGKIDPKLWTTSAQKVLQHLQWQKDEPTFAKQRLHEQNYHQVLRCCKSTSAEAGIGLLEDMSRRKDQYFSRQLIQNPTLDCKNYSCGRVLLIKISASIVSSLGPLELP